MRKLKTGTHIFRNAEAVAGYTGKNGSGDDSGLVDALGHTGSVRPLRSPELLMLKPGEAAGCYGSPSREHTAFVCASQSLFPANRPDDVGTHEGSPMRMGVVLVMTLFLFTYVRRHILGGYGVKRRESSQSYGAGCSYLQSG